MSDRQTAKNARSFYKAKGTLEPYQSRAQKAMSLLVRQAWSGRNGTPIVYSDLAQEMGIPNERNLNYPLGSVGNTLIELVLC
ncbi:hypothetical protein [Prosthecobacter vanneervenii]|uniref:Uncharacterized protein n=1 Tax=Prosthecobacter vanneervenii TaxID=48466 RepID=A0A7W8DJE2_9BACT|nr:hypothetical protein [Prosthecobacter vanneervenii]MBB5032058.1 hypothetical protein [Prosthecobacter vanneervenii]